MKVSSAIPAVWKDGMGLGLVAAGVYIKMSRSTVSNMDVPQGAPILSGVRRILQTYDVPLILPILFLSAASWLNT